MQRNKMEYKIGDHIKMPQAQFEAGGHEVNDWVIDDIDDEVIFVMQRNFIGSTYTGIFKKDLETQSK